MSTRNIRNFSIIAHIDHGKTTLTDCLLRETGTITSSDSQVRVMDSNPIEKERGITIKLAPVRMSYRADDGQNYILNLIDTPGHVDFGYEVSRSLSACEGVVLVVDATQGIQAQTVSNYVKAKSLGLVIIPVINKIDLASADKEKTILEIMDLMGVAENEIIAVSAKTGINTRAVLEAVVAKIPPPTGDDQAPPQALLITSYFDVHRGAIALVRMFAGTLSGRQKLGFCSAQTEFLPLELGVFVPGMQAVATLSCGEVGYVATGLKDARDLKVGDTLTSADQRQIITPLPGYREPTPMVYLEIYPVDPAEFTLLQDALSKLALRDAAIQYSGTHSVALGSGYSVGFLGILHAEIVLERLWREFNIQIIGTRPSVTYQVVNTQGVTTAITGPSQMPDPSQITSISEPIADVTIYTPQSYVHECLDLVRLKRGVFVVSHIIGGQTQLSCQVPLAELIGDFHDTLKSVSSGYASLEYDVNSFQPADVVKVTILLNREPIEALSFLTVRDQSDYEARAMVKKLREVLPRQNFELAIQATIGGKVIARETLSAYRKDVTAKLYGGDVTRRKKLLSKQAKGKKKMKQFGKIELDQDTFLKVLKQG